MSEKGQAASGRPGRSAHPHHGRRPWNSAFWRVVAASGLAGMATITAGLFVAGPAGASTGTAASTVTTAVYDAGTAGAWSGTEMTGASAFDTATVAGTTSAVPTGSVTYELFHGASCAGPAVSAQSVSLDSSGTVPASSPTAALASGPYSYLATYSGDDAYAPATAGCESFTVWPTYDSTDVVIHDASTQKPWTNLEGPGASAYEQASINTIPGFTPTGTVTYTLMSLPNANVCEGPVISIETVTLGSNGSVPASSVTAPLQPGLYEYQTSYSGDSNFRSSSTNECAGQFTVLTTPPPNTHTSTQTVVYDASTKAAWSGQERAGAAAYDTATVTGHSGVTPTGTVTYQLYQGSCTSGTAYGAADTVSLNPDGTVPNSSPSGPLMAGSYCYHVAYSGDANNKKSSDGCGEAFTVLPAEPVINAVKTSDPASGGYVQPGQAITYTVTVTNSGLAPDNPVTVTDTNPAATTYVPNSAQCPSGISCTVSTAPASGGQTLITWVLSMPAATVSQGAVVPATAAVTFQAAVNSSPGECTAIDNQATVDGTTTNQVSLSTAYPALQLGLTAVPQPMTTQGTGGHVSQGEVITYTITWSNTGNADATASTVTDTIPAGATYVNGSASNGGVLDPGTVTWAGLDLVAGKSGHLTFQVTVDHTDQNGFHLLNEAQVSSPPGSQPTVTQSPTCTGATPVWSAASNQTVHLVVVTSTTTTTPPTTTPPTTPPTSTTTPTPAPTDQATTSTTDPVGLAFTGSNTLRGLEAAGVVLAGGALLVLASRRGRRRRS
jgi:uncharacterized repeat protein (TIGR01451 family)